MEEILHQLIGSFSHYLQGFIHPRWSFGISEPSTVSVSFSQQLFDSKIRDFTTPKNPGTSKPGPLQVQPHSIGGSNDA